MTTQIYTIESDNDYYDNDYKNPLKAKSKIFLFGRDENRKKIMKVVGNYLPNFYVEKKRAEGAKIASRGMIKNIVWKDEKKSLYDEEVVKVECINSKVVPEIRKLLNSVGIKHFQSDVLYRLNWTLENKKKLEEMGYSFDIDNCRLFYLDIETTTTQDSIDCKTTPESIIAITIYDNYTNKYYTWSWRRDFGNEVKEGEKRELRLFEGEVTMMQDFISWWADKSPDIVMGWNIEGFDIPYIMNRSKRLGINISKLSPIGRCWMWDETYPSGETYFSPNCLGVVFLDVLHWYREVHLDQLRSGALDAVAKFEGLGVKEKVNAQYLWENDFNKLVEYNVNDVCLTKAITEKKKILDFVGSIRKVSWGNFGDLVYFSRSIDLLLLQRARELSLVLPTKVSGGVYKSKEEREALYAGGAVFAEPGIYKGGIGVFDFSALYPNIFRTFNISYETVNNEGMGIEFNIPEGVNEDGEKVKVWCRQDKVGITPAVLEKLQVLRNKYEEGMKKATATKEIDEWDQSIQSIKNLILTLYGAHAMQAFRLFKREVSSLVTFIGRTLIREIARYVKEKGMMVCYNDTDSAFVVMKNLDPKTGNELQDELNQHIKDYCLEKWNIHPEKNLLGLKFEKLYSSIMILVKKHYAGILIWKKGRERNELQIAGIQGRKSDSSYQVQYLQPKIIEMILKNTSAEEIEKEILKEVDKIKNCNNYEYIAIPVKLGKDKYQNDLPKVRGCNYARKLLNLNLLVGQKPLLLYISQDNEDALCFETNSQLKDRGIRIDVKKMCERNILMVLENIIILYRGIAYWDELKGKILNYLKGQTTL